MAWWKPWTVDIYGKWSETTHEVSFLRFWTEAAAVRFVASQPDSEMTEYRIRHRV